MKAGSIFIKLSLPLLLVAATREANGQSQQDSLYKKIAQLDSVLFNAFNTRNIELFNSFFDTGLEFFHDKGGLTGYNHTVKFMQQVSAEQNDLRRELVKGSLEVYPVPGYGAIQTGAHTFCHTEAGKEVCGTFKFVHIWQQKNKEWKITRIISYDH
jgi:hypothetical protein